MRSNTIVSLVIWAFYAVGVVYALSGIKEPGPNSKLRVTLDYSMAASYPPEIKGQDVQRRNWFYSSHLTFKSPVSTFTDGQLWQMVLDAYGEMLVSANDYDNMYRPIAMTVLAWDNQIILASSQRGPNNFNLEFKESPVYRDLQLCRQVWQIETGKRVDHNSFANCGEPMAAQLYYMLGNQPHLSGKNARMGTVIKSRRTDRPVPQNPCPPPKDQKTKWGCNVFVTSQKLNILYTGTEPEPYGREGLAERLESCGQQQLCGGYRTFPLPS